MLLANEQIELQDLARDFALKEIKRRALDFESQLKFDKALLNALWELGSFNLTIKEEFGGLSMGFVDLAVVLHEIAYACMAVGQVVASSVIALLALNILGDNNQKKHFISNIEGKLLGYDLNLTKYLNYHNLPVKLEAKSANDKFMVNGQIDFLTNASQAQWFIVPVKLDSQIQIVVIDNLAENIKITKSFNTFGKKIHQVASVEITNLPISKINILGEMIPKIHQEFLTRTNLIQAINFNAGLSRATDETVSYASQRSTFGKLIKDHQGVTFMLADMAKEVNIANSLILNCASLIDCFKEDFLFSLNTLNFILQNGENLALNAVQLLGGYGYCKEYKVEKILRDIKTSILELPDKGEISEIVGKEYCQNNLIK